MPPERRSSDHADRSSSTIRYDAEPVGTWHILQVRTENAHAFAVLPWRAGTFLLGDID